MKTDFTQAKLGLKGAIGYLTSHFGLKDVVTSGFEPGTSSEI